MVFEAKSFGQIFADMRDRTADRITDFEEGSVVRTLYESFSYELALLYEQMHQVYLSAYVDTANGGQLDLVVAILGIKRGEPDFATGLVTFERDLGIDEVIEIPAGFLVTTSEDTDENPKKAFQTIEAKTLSETDKQVQVRVQATQRGEDQATEADTIQVMPQPLPGIKAVTNEQPIRFIGKRRETDEELRDRAKTALLAASGANITAIENALFSLPGVTEVRVQENFHYARGKVRLSRGEGGTGAVDIPKGTELRLHNVDRRFVTLAAIKLEGDVAAQTVEVEAVTRGIAGQRPDDEALAWRSLELADDENNDVAVQVEDVDAIVLRDFGVLEVFVDGVDFHNEIQVNRLQQEVERVRGAGIYVLLKPAETVAVDAIFQIELAPGKRIVSEERLSLEASLQDALKAFIANQRMGQPLLMSQLTKEILAPDLVNDLVDFRLTTYRGSGGQQYATEHDAATKRLDVEVLEKIAPRHIRVASETKPLVVDVTVKAESLGANNDAKAERQRELAQAIVDYFGSLGAGLDVRKSALQDTEALNNAVAITLNPHFWQPLMAFDGETVPVSFIEQAQLGNVFIYEKTLNINGALKLMVSLTATQDEKIRRQNQVRFALEDYLNSLQPEESVDLEQFVKLAQNVEGILQVDWRVEDFRVTVEQGDIVTPQANRIDDTTLQVAPFEKTRLLTDFAIATDIRRVPIAVSQLQLRLNISGQLPEESDRDTLTADLKACVRYVLDNLHQDLAQPAVGQSFTDAEFANDLQVKLQTKLAALSRTIIGSIINALADDPRTDLTQTLLPGATYIFDSLTLTPSGEERVIRLVEQARIRPIAANAVTITVELPLAD